MVSVFVRSAMIGRPFLFSGNGFVAGHAPGLVTVSGAPAARVVHLRDSATHRLVARTISAADGTYRFSNLNPARRYYVTAFDHQQVFNAVIRDNITPATA